MHDEDMTLVKLLLPIAWADRVFTEIERLMIAAEDSPTAKNQ
jgi:hypothetical protein